VYRTDEEEHDQVPVVPTHQRRRRRKTSKKAESDDVMVSMKAHAAESAKAHAALSTALHTAAAPQLESQHDAFIVWLQANIPDIEPSSWNDFEEECMLLVWWYKVPNVSILVLLSLIQ
jgi:hypothetical protein